MEEEFVIRASTDVSVVNSERAAYSTLLSSVSAYDREHGMNVRPVNAISIPVSVVLDVAVIRIGIKNGDWYVVGMTSSLQLAP